MMQLAASQEPRTHAEMIARIDAARRRLGANPMRFKPIVMGKPVTELLPVIDAGVERAREKREAEAEQLRREEIGKSALEREHITEVIQRYRARTQTNPIINRIRLMQSLVVSTFEISFDDLLSPTRVSRIARIRMIAMCLASRLTGRTKQDIGSAFGGRDHSTVVNACRRVGTLIGEVIDADKIDRARTAVDNSMVPANG